MHYTGSGLVAALATTVSAHGYVSSPPARQANNATTAACGSAVADSIRADNTSHVEGLPELAANDAGYHAASCDLWLCRGIQLDDNVANIQSYSPGQTVNIEIKLTIPHEGNANVSIVDTATNRIVGSPLVQWASGYANEQEFYAGTLPANQTDFNITIPDVSEQCNEAGKCVLQWWWYGTGAKQSYESCVDFVVAEA